MQAGGGTGNAQQAKKCSCTKQGEPRLALTTGVTHSASSGRGNARNLASTVLYMCSPCQEWVPRTGPVPGPNLSPNTKPSPESCDMHRVTCIVHRASCVVHRASSVVLLGKVGRKAGLRRTQSWEIERSQLTETTGR